jgi:hypothetical protein
LTGRWIEYSPVSGRSNRDRIASADYHRAVASQSPPVAIIVINKNDEGVVDILEALGALPRVMAGEAEIVLVDASEGRFDHGSG